MLLATAVSPTFSVSLSPLLTLAAGILGIFDAAWRYRRPGGNPLFTIVQLLLAAIVIIAAVPQLHPYISTTIPTRFLDTGLAVILLVQLLVRSARKGSVIWLSSVAFIVAAAAAVIAFLKVT